MAGLNAGVLGLGLGRLHAKYYAENTGIERLVVCDPDPARLDTLRREVPKIAEAYTDPGEMLARERLDIVSIVTPDHLHRPHVEQCLAAGCHVLLTKPIANTRDDAEAIVAAAEHSGKQLMVAQEARYRARFRKLRELIAAGYFGDIVNIRVDSIWDKRAHFTKSPWYASAEANRSLMTGTAIHEVDAMRFLMGLPVTRVFASGNDLGTLVFPREKTVVATFDFEGGAVGQVGASYAAVWPRAGEIPDQLRIIGTHGMVVGDRYCGMGDDEWLYLPTLGNGIEHGTKGCVDAFVDAIVTGRPVPIPGEDALTSLTLSFAADESVASGQPLSLTQPAAAERRHA